MSLTANLNEKAVVLIADDDGATRLLLRETLEQSGFGIEEAENGEDAVSAFSKVRPEVVLLDVDMPLKDGFSACSEMRQLPEGRTVPIVMVTGLDDINSIHRAYEVGATDFITKPINWTILGHRVRYMLRAGRAMTELRRSEGRLANAQRIAKLGNWEWDIEKNTLRCSDETYRIFGLRPPTVGTSYEAFFNTFHPADRDIARAALDRALRRGKVFSLDHRIVLPNGSERIVHQQAEILFDPNGKALRMTGTVQDITERKKAEEQIRTLAYYDTLTELPNRVMFKEHLGKALARARRRNNLVATLLLDLDRFKRINDTLGHSVGDQLLREVAARLMQSVRREDLVSRHSFDDTATSVARLGGDEFAIMLTDLESVQAAAKVARRTLDMLSAPISLDAQEVFATASIGITVFPFDGEDVDSLLKNADTAMYHAKSEGRNNYQYYTKSMNASAFENLALENSLRRALERGEFELYYQPQLNLDSGEIVGVEALIRWQHPELGMVSPVQFIPLALETGLIVPMDEWGLRTACQQAKAWQDAGLRPMRVSVNLSSYQFRQKKLVELVARILSETRLDPQYLDIELTESTIMQNAEETVKTLHELKEMGIKLSVDDFGTGYSSLSYLKRFPLDTLKIDRSFIKDITTDPDDEALTRAILAMSNSLKLRVIAEGVETEEQLNFLRANGCDEFQGYLFSRPVRAIEIAEMLRTGHRYSTPE